MKDVSVYLRWIAALCLGMAVFGIAVFAVGYQPPSFGRVATVALLLAASAALTLVSRRARRS